jgi:hypothetical protein
VRSSLGIWKVSTIRTVIDYTILKCGRQKESEDKFTVHIEYREDKINAKERREHWKDTK